MTSALFPELQELRIELTDDVLDEQFAAITAALNEPIDGVASLGSPVDRARATWRRWVATIATAGTALVPVAAAASESSVPGDALYPIKLTVERLQVLFDGDIDAEHRVDELETLIDRAADASVIDRHIRDTAAVLQDSTDRTDLVDRYEDAVIDHARSDRVSDAEPAPSDRVNEPIRDVAEEPDPELTRPESDEAPVVVPSDRATTTTEPVRHDATTTTHAPDTTTTTVGERDDGAEEGAGAGDGGDGAGDDADR